MKFSIKVGFCVAYDWNLLRYSLPLIYKQSDIICLSLDKDRISWAGNKFDFDTEGFNALIKEIDVDKKITVIEEDFHLPELKPMENEIRQRQRMADFLGRNDGWHLQLDSDEYFADFEGFTQYLKTIKTKRAINICCPWITMYKRIDEGFLMVQPDDFESIEFIPIATNTPHYEHGRRNGHFNHYTDFSILHQSWARTKEEVWQKLSNWGHRYDSDIHAYFKLWDEANIDNFRTYKNFNQTSPEAWPSLFLLPLDKDQTVLSLIKSGVEIPIKIKRIDLILKNSLLWSYVLKIANEFTSK